MIQIAQLGQVLLNFMNVVPAGMIVFFPSYKFLNTAKVMWLKTGTLDKFALKKAVRGGGKILDVGEPFMSI